MLLYHGWSDQNFSAQATIDYYRKVVDAIGTDQTAGSVRLFLVPGMGHCGGGDGPNAFDAITALEGWVENSRAPEVLLASHRADGRLERTRPLCAYPQDARYTGAGSLDEATNFRCTLP